MSAKKVKDLRRTIRKEVNSIKIVGLDEFLEHTKKQPFRKRLKFAIKIIFKK